MSSTIRQVIGEAIAFRLGDPRISPFASVTRVELSPDLQIAKVYISVMGDATASRKTMAGLQHACGHLQRLVAGALSVRRCPELRLHLDESLKKAAELMRIIDQSISEDEANAAARQGSGDSTEHDGEDGVVA